MSKTVSAWLVFRARDESLRIRKVRRGWTIELDWDEVAWKVDVSVPDPWGRVLGGVAVELPGDGPAIVEIAPATMPPSSDG